MDKYKEYLAVNVLNECRIVSYRSLSRALKVHSNLAKQMLYDFHHKQNARKPGSLHATYLITGVRRSQEPPAVNGSHTQDGDDSFMASSSFMSSMPEQDGTEESIHVTSVVLVKEEDLDDMKTQFEDITSVHVYSLEPTSLKDIQILSDCNREVASKYANEDPLEVWKQYGTIQNPNVKRRSGRMTMPPPAPVASNTAPKSAPKSSSTATTKEEKSAVPPRKVSASSEGTSRGSTPQVDAAVAPKKNADTKPPTLKRDKSDIFKSFAKAKTKPKREDTASSTEPAPAPSPLDDEPMKDASEDDEEEEDFVKPSSKIEPEAARKAKAEREAQLRKMMEDEDEPMEDAPTPTAEEPQDAPLDKQPEPRAEKEPEAAVTITGGRRRGRRRVMKKKTMKDEDGYLVTKEEPVWESFSEEEPEPKKAKLPTAPAPAGKGKKGSGKPGQGNIMSFFAKK